MSSQIAVFLFLIDLMLLPMFHVYGYSIKLAFLFAPLFCVHSFLVRSDYFLERRTFFIAAMLFCGLILSSLLGELYLSTVFEPEDYHRTKRGIAIYILMLFSFGVGLRCVGFNFNRILLVYYAYILLTIGAVYIPESPIIKLYYYEEVHERVVFTGRSLGLFGNPNISFLHHNVIYLALIVALKRGYWQLESWFVRASLLAGPIITAFTLSSRANLAAMLVLVAYYLLFLFRSTKGRIEIKSLAFGTTIALGLGFAVLFYVNVRDSSRAEVIDNIVARLSRGDVFDASRGRGETIYRPLYKYETFVERFSFSPLIGSGYNEVNYHYWGGSPSFYHNDLFRLLATSGLIGTFFFFVFLKKYCLPEGWIMLLPFVLPGLTNTFLLGMFQVCFYFFVVGMFWTKRQAVIQNMERLWHFEQSALREQMERGEPDKAVLAPGHGR